MGVREDGGGKTDGLAVKQETDLFRWNNFFAKGKTEFVEDESEILAVKMKGGEDYSGNMNYTGYFFSKMLSFSGILN